jgi:hypothetical protein
MNISMQNDRINLHEKVPGHYDIEPMVKSMVKVKTYMCLW